MFLSNLLCFIKPFTRLETSSTFPNSHQKILQKIQLSSFNWSKGSFDRLNFLFDWLNRNQIAIEPSRSSRIFSLPFRSIKPKFWPIANLFPGYNQDVGFYRSQFWRIITGFLMFLSNLLCFIKPFTRLETSSTFSNSHQNIL